MSDEQKKISLDELPDEGSTPSQIAPVILQRKKKKLTPDPRLEALESKSGSEKVQVMQQKWAFDERLKDHSWIVFTLILSILEFAPFYDEFIAQIERSNNGFFGEGDSVFIGLGYLKYFIRHPLALGLFLPAIFKFSRPSDYIFEISFDGISTVKKIIPIGSKELAINVMLKWNEIERVEKTIIDNKEILKLYSREGHIADIIWYINREKKKAVKMLIQGMVEKDHPLRVFLEKEKELQ